jgi:hypothetical protein
LPSVTPGVPVNPDGSPINYGSIVTPTDPNISIWNLPSSVAGKNIWFDTAHGTADTQAQSRLARANPGDNVKVIGAPTSSEIQTSAEDVMAQYAAMSKNDANAFRDLQHNLYDAGFYGKSATPPSPIWNKDTANALSAAIEAYYQLSHGAGVAISFKDWVAQGANDARAAGATPGAGSGGAGSSAPILTDPDTLQRYAQMAAQAALGRNLTPGQLGKFIDTFHQQQVDSYTQAAGHNGLAAQKDDPRSSAINYVTSTNQPEFEQHQISGYTDAFLNMFLPSGSSAPNQNVDPTAVGY